MKFRLILLSCALAAVVAFAADVTGKWTYEMQGRNGAMTGTINLKADGGTLTGTVSGRGGETEILERQSGWRQHLIRRGPRVQRK